MDNENDIDIAKALEGIRPPAHLLKKIKARRLSNMHILWRLFWFLLRQKQMRFGQALYSLNLGSRDFSQLESADQLETMKEALEKMEKRL